jgi:hypothetical protein
MSQLSQSLRLAKFNSRKRRGDVVRVYDILGGQFSYSHVGNVLSGRRKNDVILSAGYRLSNRRLENASVIATF